MSVIAVAGGYALAKGVDYLTGKAMDLLEGQVKSGVIERWSRKRMEAFITAFCKQVAEGTDEASLQADLTAIVEDEQKSQALFDAYRRVALSASPVLGPRIIALVTARIVGEGRQPTVEEEKIMTAAERMTDAELIESRNWFDEEVCKMERKGTSYYSTGDEEDSARLDLWADFGPWAAKLANFGFIYNYIEVKAYKEMDEGSGIMREVGEDIREVKLRTDMYYAAEYKDLAELVTLAEKLLPGA